MQLIRRIFASLLGLVFLFSGVVKLIDPVGTGLIVSSYLDWMHMGFLAGGAKVLGTVLALTESLVGVALMAGVWQRLVAFISSLMIGMFTLVSLALVIFNPEMDCGCFGEFVHLTHLQTLIKNLILCVLAFAAFFRNWFLVRTPIRMYVVYAINTLAIIVLAIYSWRSLPYFDFTDYKPSHSIISENSERASDVTVYLPVWDEYGEDVSDLLLEDNLAVISVYDAGKLSQSDKNKLAVFASDAFNAGFTPYVLSTEPLDIPGVVTFLADRKTLMTFNRSNGGVTILENGYICTKRSINNYFSTDQLNEMAATYPSDYSVHERSIKAITFQAATVLFLLLFLI